MTNAEQTVEQVDSLINPITGEKVDERMKEREARAKGYLDFEFMCKYLEDENESVKYFIIDGKKLIVHMNNPITQYKKPTQINHVRIFAENCSIDDTECLACGS